MADDNTRKPITIWLSTLESAALNRIAKTEQRTRSSMARILLAEAINPRTNKENP